MKDKGLMLGMAAMAVYIVGGVGAFVGLVLIFLMPDQDLIGLGGARGIGYLLLCVGLVLSILGVLLMRILRNRPPR
jgi:Flp pilus assembly protein TadB